MIKQSYNDGCLLGLMGHFMAMEISAGLSLPGEVCG